MNLGITGHRYQRIKARQTFLEHLIRRAIKEEKRSIESLSCGMALGWDTASAVVAIELGIPLIARLPCPFQDKFWSNVDKKIYHDLLARAATVTYAADKYVSSAFNQRNQTIIEDSTEIWAMFDGKPYGGTFNAICYAEKLEVPVRNFWEHL